MSGLSLVSSRVKTVFSNAYEAATDKIRENICGKEVKGLSETDIEDFYDLLDSKLLMAASDKNAFSVYYFCIMKDVPRAYNRLLDILSRIDAKQISFALVNKIEDILNRYGNDKKLLDILKANEKLMRAIEDNKKMTK